MTIDTDIKDAVRRFVIDELEWPGDAAELTDDASLIEAGAIDSLSLLEVAHWLREEYHLEVDDTDVIAANFESLTAIEAFVRRGGKS
jgi:acyl carrier protein